MSLGFGDEWKLAFALLLTGALLNSPVPTSSPEITPGEAELIEDGYHNAIRGLYRNLFDELITHAPGDQQVEDAAVQHFRTGLGEARRARTIALKNLH